MSALGHKRTYAVQKGMSALPPNSDRKSGFPQKVMSALPPIADMCGAARDVRFGPKADSCAATKRSLFDHFVGDLLEMHGHIEAQRLGGL
jgi:hypothetical protein